MSSRPKEVEIQKDGASAFVLESAVDAWTRNGWTRVDDGVVEPDEPADPTSPVEPVDGNPEHEGEDQ